MNYRKDVYRIALTKVDGVGPLTAKLLISHLGSVEAVFAASSKELFKIDGVGSSVIKSLKSTSIFAEAQKEYEHCLKQGIKLLYYLDKDYPGRLKHFQDSPILLYHKGNNEINHKRTVGIVGTRSPSEYGKAMVEKIVEDLKPFDVIVVSGLAHGVDALAHRKAVTCQIPTYGIMGGGFEKIYPAANRSLANAMLKDGGIMTEFGYKSKPDREHFPMRNRLIAAMSDAVIVIESGKVGGSMITADLANQYNKDVFAVPGRNIDTKSVGCNKLIKQHQANLIESVADLSYIMGWNKAKEIQMTLALVDLKPEEQKIVDLLKAKGKLELDYLHYELEVPISELSTTLLGLEFKSVIRSSPGRTYELA